MESTGRYPNHIAVEGPIGVGKTSLIRLLAVEFNGRAIYEQVEENPFLVRFYQDRAKYAFQTQLFFLLSRFKQQQELTQQDLFNKITLSDYMFEKDKIFAYLNLDDDELELYESIYQVLQPRLVKPDLVIYLQADTEVLLRRIRRRNKVYEKDISIDYLNELNQAYNQFFFTYSKTPLLVINTSEIDFVASTEDLSQLVREIRSMKRGTQYFIPLGGRK